MNIAGGRPMRPFEARAIRFLDLIEIDAWSLKCYAISRRSDVFDRTIFEPGVSMALDALPSPARDDRRPGVGFVVLHQGQDALYVVLSWWDNENELPTRVHSSERSLGIWSTAGERESFCVWDLEVIWFERNAYVATYLSRERSDPREAYLRRRLTPAPTD